MPLLYSDQTATVNALSSALTGSLQAGMSVVLGIQGDSTSVNTLVSDTTPLRWFLGGVKLFAAKVACHVLYKAWNDVTQEYDAWQTLQNAAAGERYVAFSGSVARSALQSYAQIGDFAGDIDFRIRLAPDSWTPAATQTFLARNGGVGFRGFTFKLLSNGDVTFNWNADPAVETTITVTAAQAQVAGTNGVAQWLRATVDVDNGSGGYTATIYKSSDGVTWTQLAQSVTSSGSTTIGMPTAIDYEIGARGTITEPFAGKIFETQLRSGIGGKILDTQPIENWSTTNTSSIGGAPTLYVVNGSWAGKSLGYFGDATRFPKMVFPISPGAWILNTGHNEGIPRGTVFAATLDSYLTQLKTRAPQAVYGIVAQNPEVPPTATASPHHNARTREIAQWGVRNGLQVIDIGAAIFAANSTGGLIGSDGIHPIQAGYDVASKFFSDPFVAAIRA